MFSLWKLQLFWLQSLNEGCIWLLNVKESKYESIGVWTIALDFLRFLR